MNDNPTLNTIILYLKNKKFDDIINTNKDNIKTFITNIKDDVISTLSITNEDWNACREQVVCYIKAIKTINFLHSENPDIYNKLINCNSQKDVTKLLKNTSLPYSDAQNICRHIIKEIKSTKKDVNSGNTATNSENASIDSNISEDINKNNANKKSLKPDELKKLITKDKALCKQLSDATDEEIHSIIKQKFQDDYDINEKLIDEYIKTYYNFNNITAEQSVEINKVVLIDEEAQNKINTLNDEIARLTRINNELQDKNNALSSQLEKTELELQKYKDKTDVKTMEHVFAVELKHLNSILNSSNDACTVTVKREILSKVSKYIDKHTLLNAEELISKGRDLHSEIVQIILLAFLHSNSLI